MDKLESAKTLFHEHPNSRTAHRLRKALDQAYRAGAVEYDDVGVIELSIGAWRERQMARRYSYRPPRGWSWTKVAEQRAHYMLAAPMFPLAVGSGVVGWGVPKAQRPPEGRAACAAHLDEAANQRRRGCPEGLSLAVMAVRRARRVRAGLRETTTSDFEDLLNRTVLREFAQLRANEQALRELGRRSVSTSSA